MTEVFFKYSYLF